MRLPRRWQPSGVFLAAEFRRLSTLVPGCGKSPKVWSPAADTKET